MASHPRRNALKPFSQRSSLKFLQDFSADEWTEMEEVYARAVAAIESFIADGVKEAMNRFNARPAGENESS